MERVADNYIKQNNMTILSNADIEEFIKEGKIKIKPYNYKNVQSATIDFRIGDKFLIPEYYNTLGKSIINLDEDFPYEKKSQKEIIILPHHFILGTTLEDLTLSKELCARVDGKSKIGRKGLIVQTAGHIAPGFSGEITLELYNANQIPIRIKYGQKICQIEFHKLITPSTKPYSGRYLNQKGPKI